MKELTKKELKNIEGGRTIFEWYGYLCGYMGAKHAQNCETAPGWTTRGGR